MSTEGYRDGKQAKETNITRRTLAVFVNEGSTHALRACEIANRIKEDYHAVYSAIRRFCKYGIVKKVSKGFRKSFYVLANREGPYVI